MKNSSISEQLKLQQQDFQHSERKIEVNQGNSQKNQKDSLQNGRK